RCAGRQPSPRRLVGPCPALPPKLTGRALLGEPFAAVGYPILPAIEHVESKKARREIYHIRHSSLYAPRDFDISPYFAIIKPTIEMGFDYKKIAWAPLETASGLPGPRQPKTYARKPVSVITTLMRVNGKPYRTIWLADDGRTVRIIDQTLLPHRFEIVDLRDLADAATAIKTMQVRGAPLIGAAAAYGICLAMAADPSD